MDRQDTPGEPDERTYHRIGDGEVFWPPMMNNRCDMFAEYYALLPIREIIVFDEIVYSSICKGQEGLNLGPAVFVSAVDIWGFLGTTCRE